MITAYDNYLNSFSEKSDLLGEVEIDAPVGENEVVTKTQITQTSTVNSKRSKGFNLHQYILNSLGNSLNNAAGRSSKTNLISHTNTTIQIIPVSLDTVTTKISSRTVSAIDSIH